VIASLTACLAKQLGIWWYLWVLVGEQVEVAPDAQPPSSPRGQNPQMRGSRVPPIAHETTQADAWKGVDIHKSPSPPKPIKNDRTN